AYRQEEARRRAAGADRCRGHRQARARSRLRRRKLPAASRRLTTLLPSPLSLKPSPMVWIIVGGVAVVAAIVLFALVRGPHATDCDSLVVRSAVLDLVKQHSRLPKNTDYDLDSIRQTGSDTAAGNVSCA